MSCLLKPSLFLSHGSAAIDSGFWTNKMIIEDNLQQHVDSIDAYWWRGCSGWRRHQRFIYCFSFIKSNILYCTCLVSQFRYLILILYMLTHFQRFQCVVYPTLLYISYCTVLCFFSEMCSKFPDFLKMCQFVSPIPDKYIFTPCGKNPYFRCTLKKIGVELNK